MLKIPDESSPHYLFYMHLKAGGSVWRNDRANNIQEWIDIHHLDGHPENIQLYGYKDLSLINEDPLSIMTTQQDKDLRGDAVEECMTLAHQWALATYHKGLGQEFADFDVIRRELKNKLLALASHSPVAEQPAGQAVMGALASRAEHAVPDGWKLVPIEPTQAMYQAAHNCFTDPLLTSLMCNSYGAIEKFYIAMLTAAPTSNTGE